MIRFLKIFTVGYLFILTACAPTKRVPTGAYLYTGANIQYEEETAFKNKRQLKDQLTLEVRPSTNNPLKLWFYNLIDPLEKKKGFKNFIKYKLGEPPVLFDPNQVSQNELILEKYLHDIGYFGATATADTLINGKKIHVNYTLNSSTRYIVDTLVMPVSQHPLDSITRANQNKTKIKVGKAYDTQSLKAERERLADLATQQGYFGLGSNDLYYYVDTTEQSGLADIYVRWKPADDSTEMKVYRYGKTYVYPTYNLDNNVDTSGYTYEYKDLDIKENYHFMKEKTLRRAIRGLKGNKYDGRLQKSSLNYIQDLNVYKFVNLRYEPKIVNGIPTLDRYIFLTPGKTRDLRLDFEANTRTGNFVGTAVSANYTNRNWLGGAERLDIRLLGGVETQFGQQTGDAINTVEVDARASLSVPKLIFLKKITSQYRDYVGRTRFQLENNYQRRTSFFTINTLKASAAYDWRSSNQTAHQLSPIGIARSQTFNINPDFQTNRLNINPRLANSLEDQFILSTEYKITYNTQQVNKIKNYLYFFNGFEAAGNLASLVVGGQDQNGNPTELLGAQYAQFLRYNTDFRYYFEGLHRQLVLRLAGGIVIPYGNTDFAPYSRQFFIGGANSVRAFVLRGQGPGAFVNPNVNQINFFDQTGDIQIEFNAEYRFDLISYLKGAVFIDGGNIWLLNESIGAFNQGQFDASTFYQELALGTGLGFRLDFDFFVLRFDFAWPIRKPNAIGNGFEWVVDDWNFLDKNWRENNLTGHIAIGYPF